MTPKSDRIELGLALLAAVARPNEPLSCADIAAWCDCSDVAIRDIERKALAKLRGGLACAGMKAQEAPAGLPWHIEPLEAAIAHGCARG